MTKEEILDNALPDIIEYPHYNLDNFQRSVALDAMDEYAKVQATGFMQWAAYRGFEASLGVLVDDNGVYDSPEEYYNLFLEHQLKNGGK